MPFYSKAILEFIPKLQKYFLKMKIFYFACVRKTRLEIRIHFEKNSIFKPGKRRDQGNVNEELIQNNTAQKIKFSIKDFFSKCDKIR